MRRGWQLFRVVFLKRSGVLWLLALFYIFGVPVTLGGYGPDRWVGLAALLAIPTAGIIGIATERMTALCRSAGALGIPGHAAAVRRAQLVTLLVTVAIPSSVVAAYGNHIFAVATTLCGAAAVGILIVTRAYVLVPLVVIAAIGGSHLDWLANDYVAAAALAAALWVLLRWFRLPKLAELSGKRQTVALAGIGHEATEAEMAEALGVQPADVDRYEQELHRILGRAKYDAARQVTLDNLAVALGFRPRPRVKSTLLWIVTACLATVVWHFVHGRHSESIAYVVVTALVSFSILSRISSIFEVWRRSADEQSLIVLTPRWPAQSVVKCLLVSAVVWSSLAGWAIWLATTVLVLLLGSVSGGEVATAGVIVLAAFAAGATDLWCLLARRSLRKWHVSTILAMSIPAAGAALFWFRNVVGLGRGLAGVMLILAVAAIAGVGLAVRPLQFPVNATFL